MNMIQSPQPSRQSCPKKKSDTDRYRHLTKADMRSQLARHENPQNEANRNDVSRDRVSGRAH